MIVPPKPKGAPQTVELRDRASSLALVAVRQSCSDDSPRRGASPRPQSSAGALSTAPAGARAQPLRAPTARSLQPVAERSPKLEPQAGCARARRPTPPLTRQAARRQSAPAPPADRGDQPRGAREAAGRRDAAEIHGSSPNTCVAERLALNAQELDDFVAEIIDEMIGPRPARAAAQGPDDHRHPDQRPRDRSTSSAAASSS